MTSKTATRKKPGQSPVPDFAEGAWLPLKGHVIIKRQKPRTETAGGIALPDNVKIPQTWGQVLKVSEEMDRAYDTEDAPKVEVLDYVIYDPSSAVPLDVEIASRSDKSGSLDDLFVVPVDDMLAVWKPGENYGE